MFTSVKLEVYAHQPFLRAEISDGIEILLKDEREKAYSSIIWRSVLSGISKF